MHIIVALVAGVMFGAGLTMSDMINPARVLNFLDIAGQWDPSLIFVMGGALLTTTLGYRFVLRRSEPLFDKAFWLPAARDIDAPLILGSAMFGAGWGLAGICPGPALTALVSLEPKMFLFVAAMAAGMLGAKAWRERSAN
ncbi:MAG: DUF6691 family protein [Beijerinckiaceae bacterium]